MAYSKRTEEWVMTTINMDSVPDDSDSELAEIDGDAAWTEIDATDCISYNQCTTLRYLKNLDHSMIVHSLKNARINAAEAKRLGFGKTPSQIIRRLLDSLKNERIKAAKAKRLGKTPSQIIRRLLDTRPSQMIRRLLDERKRLY
jgi:hypothetical protein